MSAVADPRGLKRICLNCGTRFYDLNKRPVVCPSCDTEFTGEIKVKGRRGKVAEEKPDIKAVPKAEPAKAESKTANDEDEDGKDNDDLSLDDVKAMENGDADDEEDIDLNTDIDDLDGLDDDDMDDDDDLSEDLDIDIEKEDD